MAPNRGLLRPIPILGVSVIFLAGMFSRCQAAQDSQMPTSAVREANSPPAWPKEDLAKIIDLAKNDHIALLKLAIARYQKSVSDYTGTFHKQERIGRKLRKAQIITFKFKEKPFSLFMDWKKNARGADRLLYVEGQHDNKLIAHPTGLLSIVKSVKLDPHGKKALASSRQPCDRFGFHRTMANMLKVYELAQKNGDLQTKYLGQTIIGKRKCIKLERMLPKKKFYTYGRLTMQIDLEYLVPVSITCYDWRNKLVGRYLFTNLKFNVGLTDKQFTTKANKL